VTDLAEWLENAISEREAAARAVEGTAPWRRAGSRQLRFDNGSRENYQALFTTHETSSDAGRWDRILIVRDDGGLALHIAMNDPAEVLRRCAADRALIAEVQGWRHQEEQSDPHYWCWAADHPGEICDCGLDDRRERVLQLLAKGYGYEEATT
jgi:hypothetical protein